MADSRLLATLQHGIQYPAGHLDRFANFGPAFEEPDSAPSASAPVPPASAEPVSAPAQAPTSAQFDARTFITAGKAIFTLQGLQARYTYRVSRKDPDPGSRYQDPVYFVSLLTGPDNLNDYQYLGILDVQTGVVKLTKASKYRTDSAPVRAINWAVARIWRGVSIAPAQLYHIGKCGRCGRALTVPSSIEAGIGPECSGKLGE